MTRTKRDLKEMSTAFLRDSTLQAGFGYHLLSMEVYARIGVFSASGTQERSFQIAKVLVLPKRQGRGVFTEYLDWLETEASKFDIRYIYVESVLSQRFADFFRKRGYTERPFGQGPSSFYKHIPKDPACESTPLESAFCTDSV